MVREIEEFSSPLKSGPLRKSEILEHGEVKAAKSGSGDLTLRPTQKPDARYAGNASSGNRLPGLTRLGEGGRI